MIIGFACPVCLHQVPLDHYETSNCGLAIHPDYAAAVLHSNDDYYGRDLTTVTAGLGCPRSRAIEYDTDVFVNPLDYNAIITGSAWDTLMEKHGLPGSTKMRVEGDIAGIHLSGEIDRVRRLNDMLIIDDHKNSNNNAQRFLKKEVEAGTAVKMEYRIQTSIYAELYEQTFDVRPTHGMIWNHYAGASSNYNKVLIPLLYETIPLSECLSHKPYGGEFTVLELYKQAEAYHKKGTSAEMREGSTSTSKMLPADLPLAGASMNFGQQTMCDYCQVKKACMTLAGGAPF